MNVPAGLSVCEIDDGATNGLGQLTFRAHGKKEDGRRVEELGRLTIPDGISCNFNLRHAFPHSAGVVPKAETGLVVADVT